MELNEEVFEEMERGKKAVTPTVPPQEPVPQEQQKMNELMRQLIDATTVLVVKVAACDCKKKASCKVYMQAQAIAKVIDELQELRPR